LTITATVHPDEECISEADFGIRTMSTINVGINNKSDSDAILTFVELVPEWLTGSFWAGPSVVSKEYTVILYEWYDLAAVARLPNYKPELRAELTASDRIKEDKDWYFSQVPINWVKPISVLVKEISADVYKVEGDAQERFRLLLGLTSANNFLYGTLRLNINADDGTKYESDPLKFSICKNVDSDKK
jgi:hypothetical protein